MKRLIRKILREEINKSDRHYKILDKISDHVEIPYFKSMEGLTIYDKDDQEYIMKKILGNDIFFRDNHIRDNNLNLIYIEGNLGWKKWVYDDNDNMLYHENSKGYWNKFEWDDNDNMLYHENSNGLIRDYR